MLHDLAAARLGELGDDALIANPKHVPGRLMAPQRLPDPLVDFGPAGPRRRPGPDTGVVVQARRRREFAQECTHYFAVPGVFDGDDRRLGDGGVLGQAGFDFVGEDVFTTW